MSIRVQVSISHLDYDTTMYLDSTLRASDAIEEIKRVVKLLSDDESYCLYCEGRMNRTTLFIPADETLAECGLKPTGGVLELKYKPQPLWFLVDKDGSFNSVSPTKIHLSVDLHDPVSSYISVIQQKMGLSGCEYLFLSQETRKPIKLFVPLANQMIEPMSTIVLHPMTLFEKRTLNTLEGILKKGWLQKRSQKKKKITGIKKRFMVLTADLLYYFKSDTGSPAPLGVIPLDYVQVGSSPDQKHIMLTFRIVAFTPDPPIYIFDCDNVTEMAHWHSLLKQRCNTGKGVWDTPLVKLKSHHIPLTIELCVMYLRNQMRTEGLFRVAGSKGDIEKVRDLLDGDSPVQLESARPHTMAGVLMLYLKGLPEPVCIRQLYADFIAANGDVGALQKVILDLPQIHRRVLEYLLSFLCDLSKYSEENLMTPKNLAVIFAPILMPLPNVFLPDPVQVQVMQFMIQEFEAIFSSLPQMEELPAETSTVVEPSAAAVAAAASGAAPRTTTVTAASAASAGPSPSSMNEVTVLHQFAARNPRELSVEVGDSVCVLSTLPSGWTMCQSSGGSQGLVPTQCFALEATPPAIYSRNLSGAGKIQAQLEEMKEEMAALSARVGGLQDDMETIRDVAEETEVLLGMLEEGQQRVQLIEGYVEGNREQLSLLNGMVSKWQF